MKRSQLFLDMQLIDKADAIKSLHHFLADAKALSVVRKLDERDRDLACFFYDTVTEHQMSLDILTSGGWYHDCSHISGLDGVQGHACDNTNVFCIIGKKQVLMMVFLHDDDKRCKGVGPDHLAFALGHVLLAGYKTVHVQCFVGPTKPKKQHQFILFGQNRVHRETRVLCLPKANYNHMCMSSCSLLLPKVPGISSPRTQEGVQASKEACPESRCVCIV